MSELTYQATQDYLTSLVPPREQELQEIRLRLWIFNRMVFESGAGKRRRCGASHCLG